MAGAPLRWLFVGQGPMGAAALEALVAVGPPVAVVSAEPALGSPPVAATARAQQRVATTAAEQVIAALAGDPVPNALNDPS